MWPFKYVNGEQTSESKALETDKQLHKPEQFNPSTCEDALL